MEFDKYGLPKHEPWRKPFMSRTTRSHLCLGEKILWHCVRDGIAFYLVTETDMEPLPDTTGAIDLGIALLRAGIHPGL